MLRRLLPAFCALVIGFLPITTEALAATTEGPHGPPMSAVERLKRVSSCVRTVTPTMALLPHLVGDVPGACKSDIQILIEDGSTTDTGSCTSFAPRLPASNRIRAPNA